MSGGGKESSEDELVEQKGEHGGISGEDYG